MWQNFCIPFDFLCFCFEISKQFRISFSSCDLSIKNRQVTYDVWSKHRRETRQNKKRQNIVDNYNSKQLFPLPIVEHSRQQLQRDCFITLFTQKYEQQEQKWVNKNKTKLSTRFKVKLSYFSHSMPKFYNPKIKYEKIYLRRRGRNHRKIMNSVWNSHIC